MRLDNTLRDIKNASKIIGHKPLYTKLELAEEIIKRDIVFTQSLYLDEE